MNWNPHAQKHTDPLTWIFIITMLVYYVSVYAIYFFRISVCQKKKELGIVGNMYSTVHWTHYRLFNALIFSSLLLSLSLLYFLPTISIYMYVKDWYNHHHHRAAVATISNPKYVYLCIVDATFPIRKYIFIVEKEPNL